MVNIICLFGDSLTWGAWDRAEGGWGARMRKYFEMNNYSVEVYNCGVSGDTSEDLKNRMDAECTARRPTILIVAIGINDSLYTNSEENLCTHLHEFKKNISTIIKKAQKHADSVICLGLTKVDETRTTPCKWKPTKYYTNKSIRNYDAIIREESQKANVVFLELFDLLNAADLDDGLHPNSKGHEKLFQKIKAFLLTNKLIK
jgi:lysophospholipase L1-like esterase